jgi:DNA polymerase-3 subunit epsilon
MTPIAVIDFETTGLSPTQGDRATEVAIVLVEGGRVVDRFQSLMNAGVRIPPFIIQLTGISNAMVADAPPAAQVMARPRALWAARRWWRTTRRLTAASGRPSWPAWGRCHAARSPLPARCCCRAACTRRRRGTSWVRWRAFHALPAAGRAHRALADAEVAAALLARMQADLCSRFGLPAASHSLLMAVQACQRHALGAAVRGMWGLVRPLARRLFRGFGSTPRGLPAHNRPTLLQERATWAC